VICCLVHDEAGAPGSSPPRPDAAVALEAIARACSPRVAPQRATVVAFDAAGLSRVVGSPLAIAREVSRLTVEAGLAVRVAIAPTLATAWVVAESRLGTSVVDPGGVAAALDEIPLPVLAVLPAPPGPAGRSPLTASVPPVLATLARWGLRRVGQFARLDRDGVHARLGAMGVWLHRVARGEDAVPFVPAGEASRVVEAMALEWPIEGLEPLAFVLGRLTESLSAALARADRGAVEITTRLRLVTRETFERVLQVPAPIRDAKVLRTLVLLDLDAHRPPAGVDHVEVELGVVPGAILQGSLLARALPAADVLATLVGRLGALMGQARIGAPARVNTHDPRPVAMQTFRLGAADRARPLAGASGPGACWGTSRRPPVSGLRRYRLPVPARVRVERGAPVSVVPARRGLPGGDIVGRAGPWRTSGGWWTTGRGAWDRDEWDVQVAGGSCYRLVERRDTAQWEIEGELD
jgi:protein ImuB